MLSYLSIKGFGIFEDASLEMGEGLSVFTGETGAGKSMIVDAVLSAIGNRTPKDIVMQGHERASVELMAERPDFLESLHEDDPISLAVLDSSEIVFSRDVMKERSYVRVNGRIVTMGLAQELGAHLLDIHGQQDHHSLLTPQKYLSYLDGLFKEELEPLRGKFSDLYRRRLSFLKEISQLGENERERQKEIDLLSFQVEEIESAAIQEGEETALKDEYKVLSSMARLMELGDLVHLLIYEGDEKGPSAQDNLSQARVLMERIFAIDPKAQGTLKALEEALFSLEAAVDVFRSYKGSLSMDPQRLNAVSNRLDLFQKLKSKYGGTLEEVKDYYVKAKENLDRLLRAEEIQNEIRKKITHLEKEMEKIGGELTKKRTEAALRMSKDISLTLRDLGMPSAVFEVVISNDEDEKGGISGKKVREDGFDKAEFLFTANAGSVPLPLGRVASGGELSRIMLAIKSFMAKVDPVPTLIFDEIDAGIGGRAGQKVAEKLYSISTRKQVLCVTHLPQIAAMADTHYVIEKGEKGGRTFTEARKVEGDKRVMEIARMLSGDYTDVSLEHAKNMLAAATGFKSANKSQKVL